ncbi:MAG: hypothetical protein IT370_23420 [Deltaproteobacteria bacterium]|nr:hypothetical protein [Deltaproteobacteria bacterium]
MSTLLLAGCGDDEDSHRDGAVADAAVVGDGSPVDAGDGALPDAGPPSCDPTATAAPTKAIVVGTDFASPGTLASIDLTTRVATLNRATVGKDPIVRVFGTCVFVINRDSDSNIQVLRASDLALVKQYSTGAGSNPHDLAVVSATKAYVARYNEAALLVVQPLTGAQLGTVDLSSFDSGGPPEMESVVVVGGRALVSMERLDGTFTPAGVGMVAVIDTATDQLLDTDASTGGVQGIALDKANPFGPMRVSNGGAWVATVGDFSGSTGCLQLVTANPAAAQACLVTDMTFGGTISGVTVGGSDGFAAVALSFTQGDIVKFAVSTGATTPFGTTTFNLVDVQQAPGGALWAADRAATARGVRVFMPSGTQLTSAPIDIGKAPTTGGIAFAP